MLRVKSAGRRERVSAGMFVMPGKCRVSTVNSAMKANCLCCLAEMGAVI